MSTDSEIILRSVEEPAVFAELFEQHARMVGRFAARRVGVVAAEDILSETFLVAFRRRKDFDAAWQSATPWLLGIASRVLKKHRAVEAAHWRSLVMLAGREIGEGDGALEEAADRADAEASLRSLAPSIAKLPARDRDTLLLYAWGDLTYTEVAHALGVPTGTVRSRLNRVRRRLAAGAPAAAAADLEGGAVDGPVGSRA
ncbi:RNA polymerase sigma factor [Microbacterium sp. B2969]|uniref:RNA polymerase sigma factor n=1 Tax=Microbacterium alkaliflavum TaxID=3248839 RepID=A0ABW7QBT9_9MICO